MQNGMQSPHVPLRLVSADEVSRGLSVSAAVEALDEAFRSRLAVAAPPRTQLPVADGTLLVMPAAGEVPDAAPSAGVKLVTVRAENARRGAPSVQALYLIFGGELLSPIALIDGAALTDLRTSAVSALATRLLARRDSHKLLLFGAGAQARAHLTALGAVLPLEEVVVVSRGAERAAALVTEAQQLGLAARLGGPEDVAATDVICTCTTSEEPLFDGTLIAPGTHVVAVGAYQPDTRELDATTVQRGRVVVEDREAALTEAGELCIPIGDGLVSAEHIVADLAELCAGAAVRRSDADITVFKSVGLAAEDLVVANALLRALV